MNPAPAAADPARRKFAVHGPTLELDCTGVEWIIPSVNRLLRPFAVGSWPAGFSATLGVLRPYEQSDVVRHLSPAARRVPHAPESTELYEEGERFWLVDERWGVCEINILKGQWRSWILDQPKLDPLRCAEWAVLWPAAQLLRAKGIYLLPALSVVRDGWAAMVLSPMSLEPELTALIAAGYRIIGQRWTAVREEDGRLALLHVPGYVERAAAAAAAPRLMLPSAAADANRVDLCAQHPGSWQNHAFCDAVLIAEPGRRPHAHLRDVRDPAAAVHALRRAWPIVELLPQRRYGQLPLKLAQHCRVGEVQLSRNPKDLLALLQSLRAQPLPRPELTVAPWLQSKFPAANTEAAA